MWILPLNIHCGVYLFGIYSGTSYWCLSLRSSNWNHTYTCTNMSNFSEVLKKNAFFYGYFFVQEVRLHYVYYVNMHVSGMYKTVHLSCLIIIYINCLFTWYFINNLDKFWAGVLSEVLLFQCTIYGFLIMWIIYRFWNFVVFNFRSLSNRLSILSFNISHLTSYYHILHVYWLESDKIRSIMDTLNSFFFMSFWSIYISQ